MDYGETAEEVLARAIARPDNSVVFLDSLTNLHLASISPDNPLFVILRRHPAHVTSLDSPSAVYDWLVDRLETYKDDPSTALDFEIVDLAHS